MAGRVEWHGDEAAKHVRQRALQWLYRVAIAIATRCKELLSVPGTGRVRGRRGGRATHAPPGRPPFKQTGRGRASVTYEVDEASMTARVGTNVDYMRHQELGTKRGLAPRPWLRPSIAWAQAQMGRFTAGLNE